jgi:Methylamine utilisation protein MauE
MLVASSGYLVLATVLGVSGVIKLRHPRVLARQIENYQIVPQAVAAYAAAALAVTETACAPLLLLPPARRAGLIVAGCLMAAFLAAMSIALARGRRIPCACFGGGGELDTVGLSSLLRTALLGAIAVMSLPGQQTGTHLPQLLVAALLLALVFLLAETARLLAGRWWPGESA